MAKLALVYGMRLLPADEIVELDEAEIRLKNGKTAHVTMHLLEGGEKEIRRSSNNRSTLSSSFIRKSDALPSRDSHGAFIPARASANRNPARRLASIAGTPSRALRSNWARIRWRTPCTAPSYADDPPQSTAWPLPEASPVPPILESGPPEPAAERGCACASQPHYNSPGDPVVPVRHRRQR